MNLSSKVYTLGYSNVDAGEKLASWMADPKTLLVDIRYTPDSYLYDWRGGYLQKHYGRRYRWAGEYLGNVNHKMNNSPIKLANEKIGIRGLQQYLDEGYSLVLLCGCRHYEHCHRKTVVDLLLQAMPGVEIEPEGPAVAAMKCLSIRQPYADWIVHPEIFLAAGLQPKAIENRTWKVSHRGPLAIHAGSTFEEDAIAFWLAKEPRLAGVVPLKPEYYALGAIVGVAELVDIVQTSNNPWHIQGQYGWVLANAQAIGPVKQKGRQGLFEIAASLVELGEGVGA
jgi:Protein of unknown function, DUF488